MLMDMATPELTTIFPLIQAFYSAIRVSEERACIVHFSVPALSQLLNLPVKINGPMGRLPWHTTCSSSASRSLERGMLTLREIFRNTPEAWFHSAYMRVVLRRRRKLYSFSPVHEKKNESRTKCRHREAGKNKPEVSAPQKLLIDHGAIEVIGLGHGKRMEVAGWYRVQIHIVGFEEPRNKVSVHVVARDGSSRWAVGQWRVRDDGGNVDGFPRFKGVGVEMTRN
ncbi:hypothetical protein R3P38DRAFT_2760746 [Favolaschia claudopus]|uniref:Uncharacterized protein n=1 Tax=Favolaschia claudopus TaxID=2862362 RepID=A0AAW0DRS8_9AGAR